MEEIDMKTGQGDQFLEIQQWEKVQGEGDYRGATRGARGKGGGLLIRK